MADAPNAKSLSNADKRGVETLRKRYLCPHFRILVIGRANAGKTTILEKVCGVARGTKPIIYDKDGKELIASGTHLIPSIERGLHDIEHQITYNGSNFIFHDSQGFESGATEQLEIVWDFIQRRSNETKLDERLHAIWYCIPMDSSRPLLSSELEFFNKGTGNVPFMVVFTKFDGQIIQESGKLDDIEDDGVKWDLARKNAEITFQKTYLPRVFGTQYPPKTYVQLGDMDMPESDCPELTEKTADIIDDAALKELFVTTQMNNLSLCVKYGLKHVLSREKTMLEAAFVIVLSKFPHYWIGRTDDQHNEVDWFESADRIARVERNIYEKSDRRKNLDNYGKKMAHLSYKERDKRQQFFKEIIPELISLLGDDSTSFSATIQPKLHSLFGISKKFSANATCCRILVAMNIIAKLSFWIMKPSKKSIVDKKTQPLEQSIMDALEQLKREGYVKKLKTSITSESMPSDHQELLDFLFDQTAYI